MLKLLLVPKLLNIKYKLYGFSDDLIETITLGHLFSIAKNFADFVDFWDFHKIVSLKISRNSTVTQIAD